MTGGEIHAPPFASAGVNGMTVNVNQAVPTVDGLAMVRDGHEPLRGDVGETLRIRSVDNHRVQLIVKTTVPARVGMETVRILNDPHREMNPERRP